MTLKAMILAAGLGTRLRPLTNNTPKALLFVHGLPLILYSVLLLRKHGVREVTINLHHLGELIEKELGDGTKYGMKIRYSWEPEILGTGGGVRKASNRFRDAPFLVINSDVLIDVDLNDLFLHHKKQKGIATMVLRPRDDASGFTPVWVRRGNRIIGIGDDQRPSGKETAVPFMYTGVQILDPRFPEFLPDQGESCIIRQGYLPALAAGKKVSAYLYDGYWNDLGTLERYRQAESDLSGKVNLSFLA